MIETIFSQHLSTQGNVLAVVCPGEEESRCLIETNLVTGGSSLVICDLYGKLSEQTKNLLEKKYRWNAYCLNPSISSDCSMSCTPCAYGSVR